MNNILSNVKIGQTVVVFEGLRSTGFQKTKEGFINMKDGSNISCGTLMKNIQENEFDVY